MDVEHELLAPGPAEEVFARFATASGLDAWWTKTSRADPRVGGIYHFGFDDKHQWQGTVRVLVPARAIEWEMTSTAPMPDWLGTRVGAVLTPEGAWTRLHFYHRGWGPDAASAHLVLLLGDVPAPARAERRARRDRAVRASERALLSAPPGPAVRTRRSVRGQTPR
ncbi:MAG: SRPBCC domain-containing protein [Planctomycetes bacterium]|nr:SRPBCC domain-containing protein [Planctomycetota bacterium]